MNKITIKKAAHCFRTDEKTIADIYAALEVLDNFIEEHEADPKLLDDFLIYLSDRGEK